MKRFIKTSFLVLTIAALWAAVTYDVNASGSTHGIRVATRVTADSVTVGERIRVIYDMTYPDSLEFVPPDAFDTGNCRLISVTWRDDTADRTISKEAALDVFTLDLEHAYIPGAGFLFTTPAKDTIIVHSGEVDVPVRHLALAQSEPKPLKPQWRAPRSYMFLFLIAAGIVLAALAFLLIRRWRKREIVEIPIPELPPDFVALQRFDEIERMNLPEEGEFKKYYTLVVDTLRKYIEKRYGILAMDHTTEEILWDLSRQRAEVDGLEQVLREADLVKFAKYQPDVEAASLLIDSSRGIVARTAPRPLRTPEAAVEGSG